MERKTMLIGAISRLPEEKANPYNWLKSYKWLFTLVAAIVTLCVAFASSCYTGATAALVAKFDVSREIIVLGVTLFVLGVSATLVNGPAFSDLDTSIVRRRTPDLGAIERDVRQKADLPYHLLSVRHVLPRLSTRQQHRHTPCHSVLGWFLRCQYVDQRRWNDRGRVECKGERFGNVAVRVSKSST